MQAVTFQAILILIDGRDTQGQLVLFNNQLVAVLAHLDGDAHDPALKSRWNLEAGFGPCEAMGDNVFRTLDEAGAWVRQRIGDRASPASTHRLWS